MSQDHMPILSSQQFGAPHAKHAGIPAYEYHDYGTPTLSTPFNAAGKRKSGKQVIGTPADMIKARTRAQRAWGSTRPSIGHW